MYRGQAAIDHLATEVGKVDLGESSHWRKYHSSFQFTGEGFKGIQGFGGHARPYRGLRRAAVHLLQNRFRKMGANFAEFPAIDRLASEMTEKQGRAYDLDVLRQSLTVSFLRKNFPNLLSPKSVACVIGDGFASMTGLLLASGSAGRVVLVNLTKTLLVDLWFLKLLMGREVFAASVNLVMDEGDLSRALARPVGDSTGGIQVIAIQAANHELLRRCPLNIAVNIVSMQEMDPPVIAAYFQDLRAIAVEQPLAFYCCNREEKRLPDGTVTQFSAYPWSMRDKILIDELCPWHQQYYTYRPPFYRPYDGPIRHRLVIIDESESRSIN